jgi:NAD(P)-dependent dehydrogenase (short-subunit alcohol dehydrogenase family)
MPHRLRDKVAIVTGGAAGIGEATAVLFAEEGCKVVVADLDKTAGEKAVDQIKKSGGEAIFVSTDVSDEKAVRQVCEQTVEKFGKLNILVNNAATFVLKGIEAEVEDWERSLRINVIGSSLMSRYSVEKMKQASGGAIVNLSSISAFVAQPSFITYSATKAALLQMTRNMAMDLAPFNIRVNCVCPGTILTRATQDHMKRVGKTLEQFLAEEGPAHLLNRVGQPREVAFAILFLASDEASFITGTHLMVDGGYTAK